jgi:chromosome segregation ATPase
VTATTEATDRTAAAILARRQHAAGLIRDVHDALRKLRRDRTRVTFRGVAARAGVSRTFLYENPEARRLVQDAIAAANQERCVAVVEQDSQAEASWRERALNAEDALTAANREILQQRQRIADLMGQIRDLEQTWSQDGLQRLTTENTSLKQRIRQLTEANATLEERLQAARSNNRFLDRRISDLEMQILDQQPTSNGHG